MYLRLPSRGARARLLPALLAIVCSPVLVSLAPMPTLAQPALDPGLSTVDVLCDVGVLVCPNGDGDNLANAGIIVTCIDMFGQPIEGIPPEAFSLQSTGGSNFLFHGTPVIATEATDENGQLLLTGVHSGSGSVVQGQLAVVVDVLGTPYVLDNLGAGIPAHITSPDLNADGVIDLSDIVLFAGCYASCDAGCANADFDGDGCVGLSDYSLFHKHLGHTTKQVPSPPPMTELRKAEPFLGYVGCIQRDFDDDGNPATLRDTIGPSLTPFDLFIVAKDFASLSAVEVKLTLPPTVILLSTTPVAPFTQSLPLGGPGHYAFAADCVAQGPVFVAKYELLSMTPISYSSSDFVIEIGDFADCSVPPVTREACVGTPTPCDLSSVSQGKPVFVTCPAGDLDVSDTVTLTMRDQDGLGVAGLPATGFFVSLRDLRGSDRGNMFSLTPLAPETDPLGQLSYHFEARQPCRWDGCLDLLMEFSYEGCHLQDIKYVRTLNLVPYELDTTGAIRDEVNSEDMNAVSAAMGTLDPCVGLLTPGAGPLCPVVNLGTVGLMLAHLWHGCDITGAPGASAQLRTVLWPNVPNPFNPSTVITVELPEGVGFAELGVYDLAGRRVRRLYAGPLMAGPRPFLWDGTGDDGERIASGVYVARLAAGTHRASRTMVLLK